MIKQAMSEPTLPTVTGADPPNLDRPPGPRIIGPVEDKEPAVLPRNIPVQLELAPVKTPKLFWILGIAIHLLIFPFVIDLYFTSPIRHGMPVHKTLDKPFAKRVVVFVADGLRAEAIFPSHNVHRAKFLSSLKSSGNVAWGLVHTGVPTETRPGHVAIFAGLFEDPSAILTGWQKNIVEFDSVINESNHAWSLGSPDVVNIFGKKKLSHLHIDHYEPSDEDFSGKSSTINLDRWVFEKIKDLLSPQGDHCEADAIRRRMDRRKSALIRQELDNDRSFCESKQKSCIDGDLACFLEAKLCHDDLLVKEMPWMTATLDREVGYLDLIPCLTSYISDHCGALCEDGNIFFLHLLGMDTAGHVHKPDSKEYLDNLKFVDKGIEETVNLFEDYFNDNQTTFLFTSDHGMTNWGSHGDGSDHETEVPFILWGSGVHGDTVRRNIRQVDLAPLISTIIGVPIPINSQGVLPHYLLSGSKHQLSYALYANVMQHFEQYKLMKQEFENDIFFEPYPGFSNDDDLMEEIERLQRILSHEDYNNMAILRGESLIKDLLAGTKYMREYYYVPKVVTICLGFGIWLAYLTISVHTRDETILGLSALFGRVVSIRNAARSIQVFILIFAVFGMQSTGANIFSYLYPLFPVLCSLLITEDLHLLRQIQFLGKMLNKSKIIYRTFTFGILVQSLVLGFFSRYACAVIMGVLAIWLAQNKVAMYKNYLWLLATLGFAFLQIFPVSTQYSHIGLILGALIWHLVFHFVIKNSFKSYVATHDFQRKNIVLIFLFSPLILHGISCLNTIWVAVDFEQGSQLSDYSRIISWCITGLVVANIPNSPKGVLVRFGHIAACLIIPYTLMSVNIDLIFYSVLVVVLILWIDIEATMVYPNIQLINCHYTSYPFSQIINADLSSHYRRTYFLLAFIICYYFAIGNMASLNGFDPLWTRTYVATFNPILMCALIVFKIAIPFFLITCALYAIVILTTGDSVKIFKILILFLDQMVINFMLMIRSEGSWKEIGTSLSHFIVMEVMALIILLFYVVAKYVCTIRFGHYDFEEDNSFFTDIETDYYEAKNAIHKLQMEAEGGDDAYLGGLRRQPSSEISSQIFDGSLATPSQSLIQEIENVTKHVPPSAYRDIENLEVKTLFSRSSSKTRRRHPFSVVAGENPSVDIPPSELTDKDFRSRLLPAPGEHNYQVQSLHESKLRPGSHGDSLPIVVEKGSETTDKSKEIDEEMNPVAWAPEPITKLEIDKLLMEVTLAAGLTRSSSINDNIDVKEIEGEAMAVTPVSGSTAEITKPIETDTVSPNLEISDATNSSSKCSLARSSSLADNIEKEIDEQMKLLDLLFGPTGQIAKPLRTVSVSPNLETIEDSNSSSQCSLAPELTHSSYPTGNIYRKEIHGGMEHLDMVYGYIDENTKPISTVTVSPNLETIEDTHSSTKCSLAPELPYNSSLSDNADLKEIDENAKPVPGVPGFIDEITKPIKNVTFSPNLETIVDINTSSPYSWADLTRSSYSSDNIDLEQSDEEIDPLDFSSAPIGEFFKERRKLALRPNLETIQDTNSSSQGSLELESTQNYPTNLNENLNWLYSDLAPSIDLDAEILKAFPFFDDLEERTALTEAASSSSIVTPPQVAFELNTNLESPDENTDVDEYLESDSVDLNTSSSSSSSQVSVIDITSQRRLQQSPNEITEAEEFLENVSVDLDALSSIPSSQVSAVARNFITDTLSQDSFQILTDENIKTDEFLENVSIDLDLCPSISSSQVSNVSESFIGSSLSQEGFLSPSDENLRAEEFFEDVSINLDKCSSIYSSQVSDNTESFIGGSLSQEGLLPPSDENLRADESLDVSINLDKCSSIYSSQVSDITDSFIGSNLTQEGLLSPSDENLRAAEFLEDVSINLDKCSSISSSQVSNVSESFIGSSLSQEGLLSPSDENLRAEEFLEDVSINLDKCSSIYSSQVSDITESFIGGSSLQERPQSPLDETLRADEFLENVSINLDKCSSIHSTQVTDITESFGGSSIQERQSSLDKTLGAEEFLENVSINLDLFSSIDSSQVSIVAEAFIGNYSSQGGQKSTSTPNENIDAEEFLENVSINLDSLSSIPYSQISAVAKSFVGDTLSQGFPQSWEDCPNVDKFDDDQLSDTKMMKDAQVGTDVLTAPIKQVLHVPLNYLETFKRRSELKKAPKTLLVQSKTFVFSSEEVDSPLKINQFTNTENPLDAKALLASKSLQTVLDDAATASGIEDEEKTPSNESIKTDENVQSEIIIQTPISISSYQKYLVDNFSKSIQVVSSNIDLHLIEEKKSRENPVLSLSPSFYSKESELIDSADKCQSLIDPDLPTTSAKATLTWVERPSTPIEAFSMFVKTPSSLTEEPSTLVEAPSTLVKASSFTLVEAPSTLMDARSTLVDTPSTLIASYMPFELHSSSVEASSASVVRPSKSVDVFENMSKSYKKSEEDLEWEEMPIEMATLPSVTGLYRESSSEESPKSIHSISSNECQNIELDSEAKKPLPPFRSQIPVSIGHSRRMAQDNRQGNKGVEISEDLMLQIGRTYDKLCKFATRVMNDSDQLSFYQQTCYELFCTCIEFAEDFAAQNIDSHSMIHQSTNTEQTIDPRAVFARESLATVSNDAVTAIKVSETSSNESINEDEVIQPKFTIQTIQQYFGDNGKSFDQSTNTEQILDPPAAFASESSANFFDDAARASFIEVEETFSNQSCPKNECIHSKFIIPTNQQYFDQLTNTELILDPPAAFATQSSEKVFDHAAIASSIDVEDTLSNQSIKADEVIHPKFTIQTIQQYFGDKGKPIDQSTNTEQILDPPAAFANESSAIVFDDAATVTSIDVEDTLSNQSIRNDEYIQSKFSIQTNQQYFGDNGISIDQSTNTDQTFDPRAVYAGGSLAIVFDVAASAESNVAEASFNESIETDESIQSKFTIQTNQQYFGDNGIFIDQSTNTEQSFDPRAVFTKESFIFFDDSASVRSIKVAEISSNESIIKDESIHSKFTIQTNQQYFGDSVKSNEQSTNTEQTFNPRAIFGREPLSIVFDDGPITTFNKVEETLSNQSINEADSIQTNQQYLVNDSKSSQVILNDPDLPLSLVCCNEFDTTLSEKGISTTALTQNKSSSSVLFDDATPSYSIELEGTLLEQPLKQDEGIQTPTSLSEEQKKFRENVYMLFTTPSSYKVFEIKETEIQLTDTETGSETGTEDNISPRSLIAKTLSTVFEEIAKSSCSFELEKTQSNESIKKSVGIQSKLSIRSAASVSSNQKDLMDSYNKPTQAASDDNHLHLAEEDKFLESSFKSFSFPDCYKEPGLTEAEAGALRASKSLPIVLDEALNSCSIEKKSFIEEETLSSVSIKKEEVVQAKPAIQTAVSVPSYQQYLVDNFSKSIQASSSIEKESFSEEETLSRVSIKEDEVVQTKSAIQTAVSVPSYQQYLVDNFSKSIQVLPNDIDLQLLNEKKSQDDTLLSYSSTVCYNVPGITDTDEGIEPSDLHASKSAQTVFDDDALQTTSINIEEAPSNDLCRKDEGIQTKSDNQSAISNYQRYLLDNFTKSTQVNSSDIEFNLQLMAEGISPEIVLPASALLCSKGTAISESADKFQSTPFIEFGAPSTSWHKIEVIENIFKSQNVGMDLECEEIPIEMATISSSHTAIYTESHSEEVVSTISNPQLIQSISSNECEIIEPDLNEENLPAASCLQISNPPDPSNEAANVSRNVETENISVERPFNPSETGASNDDLFSCVDQKFEDLIYFGDPAKDAEVSTRSSPQFFLPTIYEESENSEPESIILDVAGPSRETVTVQRNVETENISVEWPFDPLENDFFSCVDHRIDYFSSSGDAASSIVSSPDYLSAIGSSASSVSDKGEKCDANPTEKAFSNETTL